MSTDFGTAPPTGSVLPRSASRPDRVAPISPSVRASSIEWRDLAIIAILAILGAAVASAPPLLRIPFGVVSVLLAPGYALVALIFPDGDHIDFLERMGLSIGMSLGIITIQALILDRAPGGLAPGSIRVMMMATSLVLLAGALLRRAKALPGAQRPWTRGTERSSPAGRAVRFTQAIVVANLVIAALAYAITVGDRPPPPTEFYILGREGILANYPREVVVGSSVALHLFIQQAQNEAGQYNISVRRGDTVLTSLGPIGVEPGTMWEGNLQIVPDAVGGDQEVSIRLEQFGQAQAFRTLRIWFDVRDSIAR